MHIAFNGLFLLPPMGGLETYLRELSRALLQRLDAPRLTLLLTPQGHEKLSGEDWASEATLVPYPRLGRNGLRAFSELGLFGPVADLRRADVIHSIALTGPLYSRAARVLTVADVTWITHPGTNESSATHKLWRAVVPKVAARSDEVITISQAAARDVTTHLGVPADRLTTTLLAGTPLARATPTPPAQLRERLGLGDGPIVLNVGQKGDHRNLDRLVRSMVAVREAVPGAQLIMPGPPSAEHEATLRRLADQAGISAAVHLPGFLPLEDIEGLYAEARAFVLPSLVEGFGLPVLEAMQRGTPVACTRDTAPSEIAGDAALTFDPLSESEIAASIVRLLQDDALRGKLTERGLARAATFTWARCAEETMAVYERALTR
ncbi:MAG: glycosyltransferase family 1 protein [Solirubrobacteraceae bacterium]|nr:glycosyltransferase family 1 protein [Solirubrobacteraceae bacterium]